MRFWRRGVSDEVAPDGDPGPAELPEAAAQLEQQQEDERQGWFSRLRQGLSKSSTRLNEGINVIFRRRRLDGEALEELEERRGRPPP